MKLETSVRADGGRFACIADAVAVYFRQGFKTFAETDDWRLMDHPDGRIVHIVRQGFLDVTAEIELAEQSDNRNFHDSPCDHLRD